MFLILLLHGNCIMKLSEYCKGSKESNVFIDTFDIPFAKCKISDFHNITINTTYKAIANFPNEYRTLRVDGGLTLNIFDVESGDILQKLDIIQGNIHLYLTDINPIIDGPIRINDKDGGHLYIHGSFSVNKNKFIRIIHTNDIHCSLDPSDQKEVIGFPKTISYVKSEKEKALKNGYDVLFFDAGDFISGAPLCNIKNGNVGIDAINKAEYDAVTVGNHFWDFGYDNALINFKNTNVPIVVANAKDTNPTSPLNFKQYIVKTVHGVKVGIFGLTTPYTPNITSTESIKTVEFDSDLIGISKEVVQTLREEEECDVIILLSHLGYEYLELNSNYLAENFNGIDVIIDGHSHTEIQNGAFHLNNDYQTLIVQTGYNLNNIGVTDLLIDEMTNKVIGKKAKLIPYEETKDIEPDKDITEFLEKKNYEIEQIINETVGRSEVDLLSNTEELRLLGTSRIANLVTTAMFDLVEPHVDISMIHGGGIRSSITKGVITYGDLLEILPFNNKNVFVNATGLQIKEIIKFGTRSYKQTMVSCFPFFSGITFLIDLTKDWNDDLRVTNMKLVDINGNLIEDIKEDKYYTISTSSYISSGGDGYTMFSELEQLNYTYSDVELFKVFIKKIKVIKGNEPFLDYKRINDIGNIKERIKTKKIKNVNDNENTIIVDGIFTSLSTDFNNEFQFYNYTISANNFVVSNINYLRKYCVESLSYLEANGIIYAANKNELMFAKSLDNNNTIELNKLIGKCNSMFQKFDDDFDCVVNTPLVAITVVLAVGLIAAIAALIIVVKRKSKQQKKDVSLTEPLLSA